MGYLGWGDGVPGVGRWGPQGGRTGSLGRETGSRAGRGTAQGSRQEEGAWGGPCLRGFQRQQQEANAQVAPEMRLGQLSFPKDIT